MNAICLVLAAMAESRRVPRQRTIRPGTAVELVSGESGDLLFAGGELVAVSPYETPPTFLASDYTGLLAWRGERRGAF